MAETVGSLRTAILRRIRDPNGTAHAAADVRTILSAAQRMVNAKTRALINSVTLNRVARRPLIAVNAAVSASLLRVESVQDSKRELQHIAWPSLGHHDPFWFRRTAPSATVWSNVGHDLLLVWPAIPAANASEGLLATGTAITTDLSGNDSIVTDLPDQHMPAVLDIAEQLLLLRQRLFASLKQATEKQGERADLGSAT